MQPYGGDKLGFEVVPGLTGEHAAAQQAFTKVVEDARRKKRDAKDAAELAKEAVLGPRDIVKAVFLKAKLDPKTLAAKRLDKPDKKELRESLVVQLVLTNKISKQQLRVALDVINATEEQEIAFAKKVLKKYHATVAGLGWNWKQLSDELAKTKLSVEQISPTQAFVHHPDRTVIAQVWIGAKARLKVKDSESDDKVLAQRGYDAAAEFEKRRKEYVLDANGVPTRRYTTRGINYRQLANMLGWNWDATDQQFRKDLREAGQRPRAADPTVFGAHTDTLDTSSAALGQPPEDTDRYGDVQQAGTLPISGVPAFSAKTDIRPDDPTTPNERTSLQVRNGSGDDQPMLSVAAVQERQPGRVQKIIRGNKGERFDRSEEGVAVVEVDLAAAARAGITFVNVHSEDSHKFKVAYARYKDATKEEIKRDARAELDEFIYSGRKNREVTIDRIPNAVVSGITLVGDANWDSSGLPVGKKIDLGSNLTRIADFMTDARLARLVLTAMAGPQLASKL